MTTLRPYQRAAVDAVHDFWADGGENPLVEAAAPPATTAAEVLLQIYENALREIVDALGGGCDDAPQSALEIAADALTSKGHPL